MTKELIEQYPDICAEIKDLNQLVTDTVSGSSPEPPYIKGAVSVQGVPFTERRARLERQKAEIEAFVDSLPDSGLRRIVALRAIEGLPWAQVAARMGHRYSENSIKKKYLNIFSKQAHLAPKAQKARYNK